MACDEMTTLLPDLWAGTLSAGDRHTLEAHLATCAACRAEADELGRLWQRLGDVAEAGEAPSRSMRSTFAATLAAYAAGRDELGTRPPLVVPSARPAWVPWLGAVAAAALLGVAFLGGLLVNRQQEAPAVQALHREVQTMRQMLALSLLQQQSANERLRGLSVSVQLDRPNETVLAALVATLTTDPNVNVRLSAVDALRAFANEAQVRDGLIEAVGHQESPLVQIALIDALAEIGEPRAPGVLRTLAGDDQADQAVRTRATEVLKQIS